MVSQSELSLPAQSIQAGAAEVFHKYHAYFSLPNHAFVADRQGEGPGAIILGSNKPNLATAAEMLVCRSFATVVHLSIERNVG
jgi:hypothetical protein